MTKTTIKAKTATKKSGASAPLIVLGYDEHHKPRAARFPATDAELVDKAAQLMDLKVYPAASEDLAALAKKLPEGRLYGNGRGFVPNVLESLVQRDHRDAASNHRARCGQRPRRVTSRDRLTSDLGRDCAGHLVLAQEALDYGWWEAIVLGRTGDMFTLRFRDYPKLPKFVRHRAAVALTSLRLKNAIVGGPYSQLRTRGRRLHHPPNQIHRIAWPSRSAAASPRTIRFGIITNHNDPSRPSAGCPTARRAGFHTNFTTWSTVARAAASPAWQRHHHQQQQRRRRRKRERK